MQGLSQDLIIIIIINNNNFYFTRVTQSNTRFDFSLWPSDLRIIHSILQAIDLKIVHQGIVS